MPQTSCLGVYLLAPGPVLSSTVPHTFGCPWAGYTYACNYQAVLPDSGAVLRGLLRVSVLRAQSVGLGSESWKVGFAIKSLAGPG